LAAGSPYAFGDNAEPEGGGEIDDAAHDLASFGFLSEVLYKGAVYLQEIY
jgi:hypothetical protein